MTWATSFADSAWRDLDTLPLKIAQAVVEFAVYTLPANPERMSKPLQDEFEGLRSARRGDYRVLFYLADPDRLVIVRARHRRDAYRLEAPAPSTRPMLSRLCCSARMRAAVAIRSGVITLGRPPPLPWLRG